MSLPLDVSSSTHELMQPSSGKLSVAGLKNTAFSQPGIVLSFLSSEKIILESGVIVLFILILVVFIYVFYTHNKFISKIRKLRKANETAQKNEARFKLIAEITSDVLWLSDFNFNLNYISPSVEKLLGFKVDEYMNMRPDERIPFSYLKKFKQILHEELDKENSADTKNNRSRILELELYHANGSKVWVELSCSFVRNKHGQPTGLHGDMRDVTESVKFRKYIRKRLELEHLLSDISIKSFGATGFENTIHEILGKAVSVLDISRAYISRYNSETNTTFNIFESCATDIKNRTDYQQEQSCEFSWMCDELKQGKVVNFNSLDGISDEYTKRLLQMNNVFSVLVIPLLLNDTFYGYIGFDACKKPVEWQSEDINVLQSLAFILANLMERSKTNKELIIKERSVELSMEGIAITDLDGRLTYVNHTFMAYWKCPHRKDVLNKSIFNFLKSGDYAFNILAEIRQAGKWSGELKGVRLDGTSFDILVQANLVTYVDNQPLCIQASFHDITEQKIREQELVKAKEKAEESNRLKSAFLANMSHEIRTPMNAIMGFLNLLKDVDFSFQDKEIFIEKINESGRKLLNTLTDIFESAIIEAGEKVVRHDEFDLSVLMKSMFSIYKPEADEHQIQLKMNYSINSLILKTDKYKLERVLSNLLENAIKFTRQGYVLIGAERKGNFIEFFVKDTGIGIAEGRDEKIFHAFMQEDMELNRRYDGVGLGLSICKAYVEQLGGKIWFTASKNVGSTFYFTIPYAPVTHADLMPDYNDNLKSGNLLQGRKILIAEDDQFSYLLLEISLKGLGAELFHTESGEETIEVLIRNPEIALILMDIKMKGMNGIEAVRKIRELKMTVPIITQTAFAFAEDQRLAFEAGCNEHITKPIDRDLLIRKIQKLLQ